MLRVYIINNMGVRKKCFGLTEVIVGAIIIASVFSGLIATFVGVRRYIRHANRRLNAANLIRNHLSSWNNFVRQDTWNDCSQNPLACTGGSNSLPSPAPYTVSYTVQDSGDYREVTVNLTWPPD